MCFEIDLLVRRDYQYSTLNPSIPDGTVHVRLRRDADCATVLITGLPPSVRNLEVEGPFMLIDLWTQCPELESLHVTGAGIAGLLPGSLRHLHLNATCMGVACLDGCPILESLELHDMGSFAESIHRGLWAAWAPTLTSFSDTKSNSGVASVACNILLRSSFSRAQM